MVKKKNLICWVCGKKKKPYFKFMTDDILSILRHYQAREKGEICEKCDTYFILTGEFKDATDEEMEVAKISRGFANKMLEWWIKDKPLDPDLLDSNREWEGTEAIAKWSRENYFKKKRTLEGSDR
jgi:hypothetical protein